MYSPSSARGSFSGGMQQGYIPESHYSTPLQSPRMDDLTYRYSAEFERGVPTTGIYAQDGLWDDDELSSDATTVRPGSGSTFGQTSRKRASFKAERNSVKGRSRSGTVSSSNAKDDKAMWTWSRRPSTAARTSQMERLPDSSIEAYPVPSPDTGRTVKKKKSKSMLRGKGRRGELTVDVAPANLADESFEAPPPLPSTPGSFLTATSPAVSTVSIPSPRSYPSRLPAKQDPPPAQAAVENKPPKSSWKRGMQKLFKSKSSVALREAFSSLDPNRPPLPDHLPKPRQTFGKPFSSSTPPMSTVPTARDTYWSFSSHSPLQRPAARPLGHASHPSLPADPFASSLDSPSNHSPNPLSPPKPRLSRNSPSLRDLKQFLAPSKPRLTKAKSLANIRPTDTAPVAALPGSTAPTGGSTTSIPKRVKSVALLSTRYRQAVSEEPADSLPELARPKLSRLPTESPPLLPPNPPYFPSTLTPRSSSSTPTTPTTLSIDTSSSALSPPPASPLPAPPASAPLSPVGTSPIQRSGSGPVLLPRSRSTSISLKAPPTSSSFFDLYEQLGIWPTPAEKETAAEKAAANKGAETESLKEEPPVAGGVSQSTSTTFSASSWEAAISAFPLVEEDSPVIAQALDFGIPEMADHDFGDVASESISPMIDDGYRLVDASMTSIAAVGGSTCSMSSAAQGSSNRTSTAQPTTTSSSGTVNRGSRSHGHGGRGLTSSRGDGSNEGSHPGSRDERRKQDHGSWFDGGSDHSSDSSSDEEDDRPLSTIHPQAAAAQQDAIRRKASRRAAKARAKGRNPGGGVMWDGEGGVPADVLRRRLEAMMLTRKERVFNWQLAQGHAAAPRHVLPAQFAALGIQPTRSLTDPPRAQIKVAPVSRSQTVRRDGRYHMPMTLSPTSMSSATMPPPPAIPVPDRQSSSRTSAQMQGLGPMAGPSRPTSSSTASSIHHAGHGSGLPLGPNVSRSTTAAVSRSSTTSKSRARALSNAASTHKPDAHPVSAVEPLPKRAQPAVKAVAFVGDLNGHRMVLDLYPETTAKDVLSASHHRGDLPDLASGMNWIVVEVFAELGCERPVREYETLQTIVKGWDGANQSNCFVFRQSINAPSTWTRGIPAHAPFLGAYVQYETKKGKWSKRFLETRGGQVFVSKNDKNKEEVQINTLFHDVYTTTRQYNSPKPFVFVMKRVEPASLFENSNDYTHVFCAEENIAWKLIAAVYDAKSHAIAQSQPQLLMASAPSQRRPSAKPEGNTLIDLIAKPKERSGAFTGKGLLKI